LVSSLVACGGGQGGGPDAAGTADAGISGARCVDLDDSESVVVASADGADDYAFSLPAQTASATRWSEAGNEALVLEVSTLRRGVIGHLVLHQGRTKFDYTMHAGALEAGEAVLVKVSTLSADNAGRQACVGPGRLAAASTLGAFAEGLVHAPIYRWPVQKRFNDIPIVLGWSKARRDFQTVFSNEDGGTVRQCGDGATGIQAEIARWGRAADIEGSFTYGEAPRWQRCTGRLAYSDNQPLLEGDHPQLYYGDGHNRLFEHRGGYGTTCGSGGPEKANGDLAGWNVDNPGTTFAEDVGRVIIFRPLPVELDAIGYDQFVGRREALIDRYAPWLYRLTADELAREGKIDDSKAFGMARYLYVDVRVADVGGWGDSYCSPTVSSGFRLRAITATGAEIDGPQITADYASDGAHDWKRVAIALPADTAAADIVSFQFDAYDDDGIYLTAIGDAFIPQPDGTNGAVLDYVRQGTKALMFYLDDDSSSCSNGVNTSGPDGAAYTCAGGLVDFVK
jgi:hypothetical protein